MRKFAAAAMSALLIVSTVPTPSYAADPATHTPIKHLVVIFQENVSFDHYFATYPNAQNNSGETPFTYTPSPWTGHNVANNLATPLDPVNNFAPIPNADLLHKNPNSPAGSGASFNGANAANPFRLAPSQAATQDMGHNYKPEQTASNNGKMDQFPGSTGTAGPPPSLVSGNGGAEATKGLVMGYYDGNTVTAFWNYANNYALADNAFTTTFGPSTPGAINLISGQTNGFAAYTNVISGGTLLHATHEATDGRGNYSLIGDAEPLGDVCSNASTDNVRFSGRNIGDMLNAKGITWGWFQGGFDLTVTNDNASTGCARFTNPTVDGYAYNSTDYIPHHEPFQYYASTANLTHARPSSIAAIGSSVEVDGTTPEPANHQYDSHDFFDALTNGNLPSVSFIKAPAFQDGHPGYSNPTDEQTFIVNTINAIQNSPFWDSTAIVITYDDSDGWYDHQMSDIVNPSFNAVADSLNGAGVCNLGVQQPGPQHTHQLYNPKNQPVQGRCGYGTRIPLVVVSPYAKKNYISHRLFDQTSVLLAIEDNWLNGDHIQKNGGGFDAHAHSLMDMFDFTIYAGAKARATRKLILDPATGAIAK